MFEGTDNSLVINQKTLELAVMEYLNRRIAPANKLSSVTYKCILKDNVSHTNRFEFDCVSKGNEDGQESST